MLIEHKNLCKDVLYSDKIWIWIRTEISGRIRIQIRIKPMRIWNTSFGTSLWMQMRFLDLWKSILW
jgi:hypothetical protein